MTAFSVITDMRYSLQALERRAQTSSEQRTVRELTALVEKAEALSERDARFEREGAALAAEHETALRVLRRNPHDARARAAAIRLDKRLRAHGQAWKQHRRVVRAVERQAVALMGVPGSRAA